MDSISNSYDTDSMPELKVTLHECCWHNVTGSEPEKWWAGEVARNRRIDSLPRRQTTSILINPDTPFAENTTITDTAPTSISSPWSGGMLAEENLWHTLF
eukprot:gene9876-2065_t